MRIHTKEYRTARKKEQTINPRDTGESQNYVTQKKKRKMHADSIYMKSSRRGKIDRGDEGQNYSYLWEQVLMGIRHKRTFSEC